MISRWLRWTTLDIRAVYSVTRQARSEGIMVRQGAMRKHLDSIGFIDALSSVDGRSRARTSLVALTGGNEQHASRLFELLDAAITKRSEPVAATMSVGAAVQRSVQDANDDRALWETRLASLKPIRATTAREASLVWPQMTMLVRLLDGGDRRSILGGWSLNLPGMLIEAPSEVFAWLADMSADVELQEATLRFVNRALERGATPLGYWEFRRLRLETELHEPLSDRYDTQHPLLIAYELERAEDAGRAIVEIEGWQPSSIRERTLRTLMLAQVAYNKRDFDRAIHLSLPAHEETGSPSLALVAARAMIARHTFGDSGLHGDDLANAFRLLIDTRDDLRRWGEDSTGAVALAIDAARLLNDPGRALRLTAAEPEGEATESEVGTLDLRVRRATMLAENGFVESARSLLREGGLQGGAAPHLKALIAESEGDKTAAIAYYSEALDATADYEQKGQFAVRLAFLGTVHPFVDEQRSAGNVSYADDLVLIAGAFGQSDGGLDRLIAAAHSSARLSVILSQVYEARGETELQLRSLRASAARLSDADVWLATARLEQSEEHIAEAIQSVYEALRLAPIGWGASARARGTLVELFAKQGDWDQASREAQHLVRLLPGDSEAVWTLITCQHHAGELDAAFRTWDTLSDRRRPATRTHVLVWLSLRYQFGEAIAAIEDLRDAASEWAQDEEIRRRIVGLVILPNRSRSGGTSDTDAPTLDSSGPEADDTIPDARPSISTSLIDEYFRDFPDGEIRRFTLDLSDDSSILDQISTAVGTRPDTSELDQQVFSGALPLGMMLHAHGGTLTEAVISHAAGVRFASTGLEDETSRARGYLGQGVVVDITALFALSVLPFESRSILMSAFSGLTIATDQFRDAISASQTITRFGNAGPGLGRMSGPIAQRVRPESDRSLDAARIDQLIQLIRPLERVLRPEESPFPELASFAEDVWFSSAEVAGTARPLWSDDAVLNKMASDIGIDTFSTLALVEALRTHERLEAVQADEIRAQLLVERYVEIPFDLPLYRSAMTLREDAPYAVGSVIEHLGGQSPNEVMDFAMEIAGSLTSSGHTLGVWISACTRWLAKVSPDDRTRRQNLRVFTSRLSRTHWFMSQTFPFVDSGVRDGLDQYADLDPMVEAVRSLYAERVPRGERRAALWLFELIAAVDPPARPRLTAIAFE